MIEAINKARTLVEALPNIRLLRRKFIVVKIGGSIMSDTEMLRSILTDLVFMENVGMWPVLVHGGGPAINAEMKNKGVEPKFIEGQRVTTPEMIRIVARVLIEEISEGLCDTLEDLQGKAIPLNGRGSKFLLGKKRVLPKKPDVDLGLVGEITNVDREMCYRLADGGLIPVVAPVARMENATREAVKSGDTLLNINGDSAAAAIAMGLGAAKVVFMSDVPGVLRNPDEPKSLIPTIKLNEVEGLEEDGTISGGMIPKVRSCVESVESGVGKAHIISASTPHALLLELFTESGIGTEIVPCKS